EGPGKAAAGAPEEGPGKAAAGAPDEGPGKAAAGAPDEGPGKAAAGAPDEGPGKAPRCAPDSPFRRPLLRPPCDLPPLSCLPCALPGPSPCSPLHKEAERSRGPECPSCPAPVLGPNPLGATSVVHPSASALPLRPTAAPLLATPPAKHRTFLRSLQFFLQEFQARPLSAPPPPRPLPFVAQGHRPSCPAPARGPNPLGATSAVHPSASALPLRPTAAPLLATPPAKHRTFLRSLKFFLQEF
ncbi:unnamed protein product, partial [Rangifer tarandus platyrhynchus]